MLTELEKQLVAALVEIRNRAIEGHDGGAWTAFRCLTNIQKRADAALAAAKEKEASYDKRD